jgi:hypothetical protein
MKGTLTGRFKRRTDMVCNDAARRLCDGSAAARICRPDFFLRLCIDHVFCNYITAKILAPIGVQPVKHYLFWLGTAGVYTVILFVSYSLVPFFEANILNHTWPVLLIVFTAMLHNERVTAIQIFGGIVSFIRCRRHFPAGGRRAAVRRFSFRPCARARFGVAMVRLFRLRERGSAIRLVSSRRFS